MAMPLVSRNGIVVSTSPADLQKLAAAFGLVYYKENNQITHSMDTVQISPDGTVKWT